MRAMLPGFVTISSGNSLIKVTPATVVCSGLKEKLELLLTVRFGLDADRNLTPKFFKTLFSASRLFKGLSSSLGPFDWPLGVLIGETIGVLTGEPIGDLIGESFGALIGKPMGALNCETIGDFNGESFGCLIGDEPMAALIGETLVDLTGEPLEDLIGDPLDELVGDFRLFDTSIFASLV